MKTYSETSMIRRLVGKSEGQNSGTQWRVPLEREDLSWEGFIIPDLFLGWWFGTNPFVGLKARHSVGGYWQGYSLIMFHLF